MSNTYKSERDLQNRKKLYDSGEDFKLTKLSQAPKQFKLIQNKYDYIITMSDKCQNQNARLQSNIKFLKFIIE